MLVRKEKAHLNLDVCLMAGMAVALSTFIGWFIWIRSGNGFTTLLAVLMILVFCSLARNCSRIP